MAVLSNTNSKDQVIDQITEDAATHIKAGIIQTLSAVKDPKNFKLKTSALKVDNKAETDTVGNVVKSMIEETPKTKQQQILAKVAQPAVMTPALKIDFVKNNISLSSEKHVLEQPAAMARFNYVTKDVLKSLATRVDTALSQTTFNNGVTTTTAKNKSISFKIHQVKCIDETGGWLAEKFGDDEIDMGGVAIDDKTREWLIPAFRVDSSFDDGETKTYTPPKVLKSFILDSTYPKVFNVFVGLAEKDSGSGFVQFLDRLFGSVKSELKVIMEKIALRLGATLGSLLGGKLGEILGTLAARILNKIIDFIKGLFGDDVFEPKMAVIKLRDAVTGFGGNILNSPLLSLDFSGHSGYYRVFYSWELKR
jgi:hypothetical protein